MGGIFAVQAALQKPEWVKGLVLVATSGGINLAPFHVADWREDYRQTFAVPSWFMDHRSYLDDVLTQISCPVLLIWGDSDPISPVKGEHDLAHVFADQVAGWVEDFLSEHECTLPQ
ncbi:hypothetical protein FQR65_LT18137 [Abscondita terminalis]|nr:hypothetical protein FQR65_LT18137 [Abscondita terminalis]